MEGIPRVPMLAPDIKIAAAGLAPEFSTKIKQYIAEHYMADPSQFDGALNEIDNMRNQICRFVPDQETICVMRRYYAQMLMLKMRFPMEEGDLVAVPFAWLDRTLEMPTPAVFDDINFELACILYNIGVLHASIGVNESRVDLDSIKNAFMQFQLAAWPLKFLRDEMNLNKFATMDFENAILTWYINLLLNQAQECILEKSMIDHKKSVVVATLAFFLRDSYHSCKVHLEVSSVSEVVSSSRFKEWVRTCNVKSNLYNAIGHLYLGIQADEEQKMGIRLAHYNIALDLIKTAQKFAEKDKRESLKQAVHFAFEVITGKQTNAAKENDFIYHDRVPKFEDLEIPEGKSLIKPIAFDPQDRSVLGDDLFSQLLPVTVIRSVSVYEEEKSKLKRKIEDRIDIKDNELQNYLFALELNQINIDREPDEITLPDDLLEASAYFSAQPEVFAEILNKLHEVGDRSREVEGRLNDLKVRIDRIDLPEMTSDKGYQVISQKLSEYITLHGKYRDGNTDFQNAIADQSENIRKLSLPLYELKRMLVGTVPKLADSEDGRKLKRVLDKVDEMRLQRMQLLDSLKDDLQRDEIAGKLLAEKHEDNSLLFDKELQKHDKLIAVIDQNLNAQDKILQVLTEANANYASVRHEAIELSHRRSEQILTLINAYVVFVDVNTKAGAGLNFYDQLMKKANELESPIATMEAVCQKEKAGQEERQRAIEDRMRAMQLERETSETMNFFGAATNRPPSEPNITGHQPQVRNIPDRKSRPKAGDYLAFYRSKMSMENSRPDQQHFQQPCAPVSVQQPVPKALGTEFSMNGVGALPQHQMEAHVQYSRPTQQFQQPSATPVSVQQPEPTGNLSGFSMNGVGTSPWHPMATPMQNNCPTQQQFQQPSTTPVSVQQPVPKALGTEFSMNGVGALPQHQMEAHVQYSRSTQQFQQPSATPVSVEQPEPTGNLSGFSMNGVGTSPWHPMATPMQNNCPTQQQFQQPSTTPVSVQQPVPKALGTEFSMNCVGALPQHQMAAPVQYNRPTQQQFQQPSATPVPSALGNLSGFMNGAGVSPWHQMAAPMQNSRPTQQQFQQPSTTPVSVPQPVPKALGTEFSLNGVGASPWHQMAAPMHNSRPTQQQFQQPSVTPLSVQQPVPNGVGNLSGFSMNGVGASPWHQMATPMQNNCPIQQHFQLPAATPVSVQQPVHLTSTVDLLSSLMNDPLVPNLPPPLAPLPHQPLLSNSHLPAPTPVQQSVSNKAAQEVQPAQKNQFSSNVDLLSSLDPLGLSNFPPSIGS